MIGPAADRIDDVFATDRSGQIKPTVAIDNAALLSRHAAPIHG
jgi:hypothetical protein